jgi:hypothetical protein
MKPDFLRYRARQTVFQADDEGSIPFTRSNYFNDLLSKLYGLRLLIFAWVTLG